MSNEYRFGEEVWLRQRLTHDFEEVLSALDLVYQRGAYGGTNMVDAIGVTTDELLGKGESEKYLDSVGRDAITVHYQAGQERSLALEVVFVNEKHALDLEVSLEQERRLKLKVERLGKSTEQLQRDVDRDKREGLRQ